MKKLFLGLSIMMLAVTADAQSAIKPTTTTVKPVVKTTKPVTTTTKPAIDIIKPPPAGDAKAGEWYGEKVPADGNLDEINNVVTKLDKGVPSITGKFIAKIKEVCTRDGCSLKLELENGRTAIVHMKDTTVFFPLAAKGTTVIVNGETVIKTVTVEELKKEAAHLKKTKEEMAAIKDPEKQVRVIAKGIVVITQPATTTTRPVTTVTTTPQPTKPPPAGDAKPGDWYGEKFNIERGADDPGPDDIKDVVAKLNKGTAYKGWNFTAKITEVCPIDGCSATLELPNGKTAILKMVDNTVFLPLAAKGKKVHISITAGGKVEMKTVAVEELKNDAKHLKKTTKEIDAITKPEEQVIVVAKGIVVLQ